MSTQLARSAVYRKNRLHAITCPLYLVARFANPVESPEVTGKAFSVFLVTFNMIWSKEHDKKALERVPISISPV